MFVHQGHSGCRLELLTADGQSVVRKSTQSVSYGTRLRRQADKQEAFSHQTRLSTISAPPVLSIEDGNGGFSFVMPFVAGLDGVTFVQRSSRGEINALMRQLLALVDDYLDQCDWQAFPRETFEQKLIDIGDKLKTNMLLSKGQAQGAMREVQSVLAALASDEKLPVGHCHGDLTLANMHTLLMGDQLVLIDFLDSFVETPLQDMVKLRQDTRYMWSSLLYRGQLDRVRHTITMRYMDAALDTHFRQHNFYRKYYPIFQQVSLLRVLSYATRADIVHHILNCLEHNFTHRTEYER